MAATTKTWVNGLAPTCEDVDLNGFKNENNNLIIGSGQGISTADNQQTHKAVSHYSAVGDFYVDSGVANAYVLSVTGVQVAPPTYATGMRIRFRAGNLNTGASNVNVAGLGVKDIVRDDSGNALTGDEITLGLNEAYYDGTAFRLTTAEGDGALWTPSVSGGTIPGTGWNVFAGNNNWRREGKLLILAFKLDIITVSGDATGALQMAGPTGFTVKAVASAGTVEVSKGIAHTSGFTQFTLDVGANDLSIIRVIESGHATLNARIVQISDLAAAVNLVGTVTIILE